VFQLVLLESVILSFLGGMLGVGAAILTLKMTSLSVAAEAVSIAFTASVPLAVTGLAVSLVAGLLAGIAPAWHAARTEIVPALRQG
jgi:putative ABC transport system permease protein